MIPLIALCWLSQPALAQSPEPEERFLLAARAYDEGEHGAAVAEYDALLAAGRDTGPVLYNRGNALLRLGDLGGAIASYRQAAARRPRDADIAANLAFARSSTRDDVAPPEPSVLARVLFFWHHGLSLAERLWALLAVHGLFWIGLAARLADPRRRMPRSLLYILGGGGLLLAASVASSWWAPARVAVVGQEEVTVRAGTRQEAVARFKLHQGTEAAVVDQRGDWVRIELSDGKDGWLPAETVHLVELR